MTDHDLSQEERDALATLAHDITLPDDLEDRAVGALRAAGYFPASGRRGSSRLATAAALAAVFAAGYAAAHVPLGSLRDDTRSEYLLLLYGGSSSDAAGEAARVGEYRSWAESETQAGRLLNAGRLADAVKIMGAPAKQEFVAWEPSGYFLIRAADPMEAATIAAGNPHMRHGGTVVVRPIANDR